MKISTAWGAKNSGAKFTVKADDLESALEVLEKQDEWGHFSGDATYDSKGDADGNVSSVVIKPAYTITLPTWPALSKQPKTCKAEWERMSAALRKHEDGHRDLFVAGIASLEKKLKALDGATHAELDTLFNDALAGIQAEHDRYDARTRHGQTEGVSLTIKEECKAK